MCREFFVFSRYFWPPESKSKWCKCVHVERSEIWVKKCNFLFKKYVFSMFRSFYIFFSFLIRIDNNFQIKISVIQLHTYCSLCILIKNCEFSVFSRYVRYAKEFTLVFGYFWIDHFEYFLIHMLTCWELHILGQKAVLLLFFDKNVTFFRLYRICRDFFFCLKLNLSSWFWFWIMQMCNYWAFCDLGKNVCF